MTKCTACNATYAAVGADGVPYAHVCALLGDNEVGAALLFPPDVTTWSKAQATQVAAAPRVRPNARNENVPSPATLQPLIAAVPKTDSTAYWKAVNAINATAMVAAGAGTTTV